MSSEKGKVRREQHSDALGRERREKRELGDAVQHTAREDTLREYIANDENSKEVPELRHRVSASLAEFGAVLGLNGHPTIRVSCRNETFSTAFVVGSIHKYSSYALRVAQPP